MKALLVFCSLLLSLMSLEASAQPHFDPLRRTYRMITTLEHPSGVDVGVTSQLWLNGFVYDQTTRQHFEAIVSSLEQRGFRPYAPTAYIHGRVTPSESKAPVAVQCVIVMEQWSPPRPGENPLKSTTQVNCQGKDFDHTAEFVREGPYLQAIIDEIDCHLSVAPEKCAPAKSNATP